MNKKNNLVGALILLPAAFIWGTTFVAQSDAMSKIGPITFQAIRSAIGAIFLTVLYFGSQGKQACVPFRKENLKKTLKIGILCGVLLFVSVNFQQIGLVGASPGKSAFITALYILGVPIIGVFIGKRPSILVWICVAASIVGFYLLNITPGEGFGLNIWDIMVVICAVTFSFHIMAVDKYSPEINSILLSCIQFWVVTILSVAVLFLDYTVFEYALPTGEVFSQVWFNLLYAGLFSSGIAYTLQIAGQKRMSASGATLIMSLESVFAAVSAWIYDPIGNAMSVPQLIGCTLIFAAICISQLDLNPTKKVA